MKENLLLIAATILWGIWGITNKYAIDRAHPFTVQWMYSIPIALAIPVWYWLGTRTNLSAYPDSASAFWWAVGSSVAATLALLLMLFALQNTAPSIATAITAAYPVVTLMIGVLLRVEELSPSKLIGIILIVVGIIVVQL